MTWLCAHLVFAVELIEGRQDQFPLLEQVYLLDVQSRDMLLEKVKSIAKNAETDEGLMLDDVPARMRFLGLRRVVTIANFFDGTPYGGPPGDKTLLTDFRYAVKSAAEGALDVTPISHPAITRVLG